MQPVKESRSLPPVNDPTDIAITMGGACGYLLAGIVLIAVGAVSARPVEPRAGYLAITSGVFMMLDGCCNMVPWIALQADTNVSLTQSLYSCNAWIGMPLLLVQGAGMIGAAFLLAQKLSSTEGRAQ